MTYVVDASVAAEYLLRTPLGVKIASTLQGAQLFAPELLDVEVLSVLRRGVARQYFSAPRATEALVDLTHWPVSRIPHRSLVLSAWTYRNNVSAYDAFYVAVARDLDVPLLTADGPLARAPIPGVMIQNVRLG